MKLSTGLQNYLSITGALKTGIDGGVIKIYGSPSSQAAADALIPADPDSGKGSATLLVTISNNGAGTGINMDTTPTDGVLPKASGETWKGTVAASGYASFAFFCTTGDALGSSATEKRLQMTAGVAGKEITLQNAYLTISQEQRIDSGYLRVPIGS